MSHGLLLPFYVPVFALVGLFIAWIYYTARTRWTRQPFDGGRLYRCSTCGHVYVEARDLPMARCPECNHLNESVRR